MTVAEEETPVVLPDDASFGPEVQVDYPGYRSTRWRAPTRALAVLPESLHDLAGPVFGPATVDALDHDLTRRHDGDPLGERIIVHGRVLDEDGRPIRSSLIEIWQANAAGRYRHEIDRHPAPLDPNFSGAGRCLTDDEGVPAVMLPRTPSQTVGPFYAIGLCRRPENELARDGVVLAGRLLDGREAPIDDGVIELSDGVRWGRSSTDGDGRFSFVVTKPGARTGEAPHFEVFVFARGLLRHQLTRIYFPDETDANAS